MGPVLDCAFAGSPADEAIVSGGADRSVYFFRLSDQAQSVVGVHKDVVKSVAAFTTGGRTQIVSASYDRSLCLWVQSEREWCCARRLELAEPPHCLALSGETLKLLVACENRVNLLLSACSLEVIWTRESSLKHATRAICWLQQEETYATSSVEGRVSVEFVDDAQNLSRRFAFKCHRQVGVEGELVYPVNALAVHPVKKNVFATGGSDSVVSLWNSDTKRRVRQLPPFSCSISQLAFSPDGKLLAVAASYVYDQGNLPVVPPHSVHLVPVAEADLAQ